MKRFGIALVALAVSATALAQAPQRVPRETATGTVGGKKVTIDYGRPALKGRALGDLLTKLPDDRIWRAGENEVTILTTEGDLMVGAKKVPAGKYSVYVHIPASGDWSLVLNSDPGIALIKIWDKAPPAVADHPWPRLDGYTKNVADKEVARAAMKANAVGSPADTFTVSFAPAKDGSTLTMAWGDKSYSLELKPAK
jgi:hypothetical protein